MGGPNLEVFKFGMYIMFPIGIMYYFGTNLDSRFAVPDFWPKPGQTHTIPFERAEIEAELGRLKERRLAARERRLELEKQGESTEITAHREEAHNPKGDIIQAISVKMEMPADAEEREGSSGKGFTNWLR